MSANTATPRWIVWCLGVLALVTIAIVIGNIFLHRTNLQLQETLAQRQQFINDGIRISRFNSQFVQALATLSAQADDAIIRDLLASHGITFTVNLPTEGANDAE